MRRESARVVREKREGEERTCSERNGFSREEMISFEGRGVRVEVRKSRGVRNGDRVSKKREEKEDSFARR
ncbi:MAG: hypothetical protein D6679_09380 [Candidatus Hydrogenedentota bacterium]|nr:MAG: hypothetical protein D6679_09380 [Candidatus Hydrogenedentota bacterium]